MNSLTPSKMLFTMGSLLLVVSVGVVVRSWIDHEMFVAWFAIFFLVPAWACFDGWWLLRDREITREDRQKKEAEFQEKFRKWCEYR